MEKGNMINDCKLLVIGGSAGSLALLISIFPKLVPIKSFAIVIILHRKNSHDSSLENVLAMKTSMSVKAIEDKDVLVPGMIYIAPADYHLLFETSSLFSLDASEKVNYSRPSIDVSFESAAAVYKSALVGLLLSGANADGTEGLKAIRKEGGITAVQKPDSAEVPFMPQHAMSTVLPDYILDNKQIVEFINSLNSAL